MREVSKIKQVPWGNKCHLKRYLKPLIELILHGLFATGHFKSTSELMIFLPNNPDNKQTIKYPIYEFISIGSSIQSPISSLHQAIIT